MAIEVYDERNDLDNSDIANTAYITYTISSSDPSGGSDGDVWYKVS